MPALVHAAVLSVASRAFLGGDAAPGNLTEAICSTYPWMCSAPVDCRNEGGQIVFEELKQMLDQLQRRVVNTPGQPNLRSWCVTPSYWEHFVPTCLVKGDLMASARKQFQWSVQRHPIDEVDASYCFLMGHCENVEVTEETTREQAITMCNKRFPEPNGWQSVGFNSPPKVHLEMRPWITDEYTHLNTTEQAEPYLKLACAQGNYHCDVMYCKETYCKTVYYRKKYQHLVPGGATLSA
mmetsp:Transcript_53131/g.99588  ORF Transcript_53131/g.99588 Transcript_53131/m.99588 type:complete len:238 (-) Transcript_53131:73-786(-)